MSRSTQSHLWKEGLLALLVSLASTPGLHSEESVSAIRFAETAADAGIEAHISHGSREKAWIAEANGSGAAVLDYDDDGWMDIVLVGGATMSELRRTARGESPEVARDRVFLYRNSRGKRFEDVTPDSGLASRYWNTGANAADYDNDGDVDILITTIGTDLLFRNEGNGTFREIGRQAGLSRVSAWHTGSSFGDIDADGDLDLYIAGYLSIGSLPLEGVPPVCDYKGLDVFCGPLDLEPGGDILYRNNGDGSFSEITSVAEVRPEKPGYGFTPVVEDFNGDSRLDIFVTNDSSPNFLFLNQGRATFREDALGAGLAYNADGKKQADMGTCLGDYDSDGDLDILTTTFSEDYFPLYEQLAQGIFEDVSHAVGLRRETTPLLGWSCGFSDLDNDGDRDIWIANGHVYPTAGKLASTAYHQPVSILENHAGRFRSVAGAASQLKGNSHRGAASADFDNDGGVDLLVLPIEGTPALLMNRSTSRGRWLGVRLRSKNGNREGIGSLVEIEYCGIRQVLSASNGSGYASRSDPRLHFGMGECSKPGSIAVRWPQGGMQTLHDIESNQWLEIKYDEEAAAR